MRFSAEPKVIWRFQNHCETILWSNIISTKLMNSCSLNEIWFNIRSEHTDRIDIKRVNKADGMYNNNHSGSGSTHFAITFSINGLCASSCENKVHSHLSWSGFCANMRTSVQRCRRESPEWNVNDKMQSQMKKNISEWGIKKRCICHPKRAHRREWMNLDCENKERFRFFFFHLLSLLLRVLKFDAIVESHYQWKLSGWYDLFSHICATVPYHCLGAIKAFVVWFFFLVSMFTGATGTTKKESNSMIYMTYLYPFLKLSLSRR